MFSKAARVNTHRVGVVYFGADVERKEIETGRQALKRKLTRRLERLAKYFCYVMNVKTLEGNDGVPVQVQRRAHGKTRYIRMI